MNRKLIFKIPSFVKFVANLPYIEAKPVIPGLQITRLVICRLNRGKLDIESKYLDESSEKVP